MAPHFVAENHLKGKRIATGRVGTGLPQLIGVILGQIGLAVPSDVELVTRPASEAIALRPHAEL